MHSYNWNEEYDNESMNTQECTCPHCGLTIAGVIHCSIDYAPLSRPPEEKYYVLECPSCGKPMIYEINEARTFPSGFALRDVKHLTQPISAIFKEIIAAIGAGCFTAAVVLARTAINHIAVDRGAEENKSFQYYVQYMVDHHFIPPNAHGWVDKIRQMANESVHDLHIWKRDDAEVIGKFLMYLLIFIYELPTSI